MSCRFQASITRYGHHSNPGQSERGATESRIGVMNDFKNGRAIRIRTYLDPKRGPQSRWASRYKQSSEIQLAAAALGMAVEEPGIEGAVDDAPGAYARPVAQPKSRCRVDPDAGCRRMRGRSFDSYRCGNNPPRTPFLLP